MNDTATPNLTGITMTTEQIAPVGWAANMPGARSYMVTLTLEDRTLTTPFSMGSAYTEAPPLEDVMDCLASDASLAADREELFEVCDSLANFDATIALAEELRVFLGDRFDSIVYPDC